MELRANGFDWDNGNLDKCWQHGVQIEEIEAVFRAVVWMEPDPSHSGREHSFKAIGTGAPDTYSSRSRCGVAWPAEIVDPADQRPLYAQEGNPLL